VGINDIWGRFHRHSPLFNNKSYFRHDEGENGEEFEKNSATSVYP
jgi:hypothetical protein